MAKSGINGSIRRMQSPLFFSCCRLLYLVSKKTNSTDFYHTMIYISDAAHSKVYIPDWLHLNFVSNTFFNDHVSRNLHHQPHPTPIYWQTHQAHSHRNCPDFAGKLCLPDVHDSKQPVPDWATARLSFLFSVVPAAPDIPNQSELASDRARRSVDPLKKSRMILSHYEKPVL